MIFMEEYFKECVAKYCYMHIYSKTIINRQIQRQRSMENKQMMNKR